MKNPLRKLPTKPGRTKPSSRVKKTPKPGNKKFIGPLSEGDEIQINEGSSKFAGPYAEYNEADNRDEPVYRDRTEGQQFHRDVQQEQSKRGRKREYTSERKRQFRLQRAGIRSDFGGDRGRPLKADDIYYKLRENLSPANQRLLDILTRNTKEQTDIPF